MVESPGPYTSDRVQEFPQEPDKNDETGHIERTTNRQEDGQHLERKHNNIKCTHEPMAR